VVRVTVNGFLVVVTVLAGKDTSPQSGVVVPNSTVVDADTVVDMVVGVADATIVSVVVVAVAVVDAAVVVDTLQRHGQVTVIKPPMK
jgi:hypothetical protein